MHTAYEQIIQQLRSGKLSHAILLDGGSPEERRDTASEAAKALVCCDPEPPCGICAHCKKAQAGTHPDISVFSGGTTVGSFKVDAVREIRRQAVVMPNEAERKVFILEHAETMSAAAQNALLKILEEPPAYVSFILTAKSHTQLLDTVLSRVSLYALRDDVQACTSAPQAAARASAERILLAAAEQNEWAVLCETGAFEKDKDAFRLCCTELANCANEALKVKLADVPASPVIEQIAATAPRELLYKILQIADETVQLIAGNINGNLLISCFSARLIAGKTEG